MVSNRSQLIIRARRFASSRRFVMKTTSGTFMIDESIVYREITVTRVGAVNFVQPRPVLPGKPSGSGTSQQSPVSMRHISSLRASQTIHRIVMTNVATGCRRQIAFDVRQMHSKRGQEYLAFGRLIARCSQTKEDVKLLRSNSSQCKGHHGKRF